MMRITATVAEAEVQHMSVLPAGHTVDEVVGFKNHFT